MLKKLALLSFVFGSYVLNANTGTGISVMKNLLLEKVKNSAQALISPIFSSTCTSTLITFFNALTGKASSSIILNIIKSLEKNLPSKMAKSILKTSSSNISTYSVIYNETLKEVSQKVFEKYNPGYTGTIQYSIPLKEFLSYSRELNRYHDIFQILNYLLKKIYQKIKNMPKHEKINIEELKYLIRKNISEDSKTKDTKLAQQENTNSDTQLVADMTFSVFMIYIDTSVSSLHEKILENDGILDLLNSKYITQSNQKNINKLFDAIKLWETICALTENNNIQETDTNDIAVIIRNTQNVMQNIPCFNDTYKDTILKLNPQNFAERISDYIKNKKTEQNKENIDNLLSADSLNIYIPIIKNLMDSIEKSITKSSGIEIVTQINKNKAISDYLNNFFDKVLNHLVIENKNERMSFMKIFKHFAENFGKKIYISSKNTIKINVENFCKKIETYITPKNQRNYIENGILKKITHPFSEVREQVNITVGDIDYSKGAIYTGTKILLNYFSWVPAFCISPTIMNIIGCTFTEIIDNRILDLYNRKFITNDIKEVYSHMSIDKIFISYISYVLSKINSEIRSNEYKKYFNYITKSKYWFDHTKSDHLATIVQLYVEYLSNKKNESDNLGLLSKNFIDLLDKKLLDNNLNLFRNEFDNIIYESKNWENFSQNYRKDPSMQSYVKKYFSKLLPMINELVQFFYCSELVLKYIKYCSKDGTVTLRNSIFINSKNKPEQVIFEFLKFFTKQYDIDLSNAKTLDNAKTIFFNKINEKQNAAQIKFLFINSINVMINLASYQLNNKKSTTSSKNLIQWLTSIGVSISNLLSDNGEHYTNFIKIFFYDTKTLDILNKKSSIYRDLRIINAKI